MALKLYNTLTRQKEEFVPIKGKKVGLYTCGPTVYNFAHIGNLRAYIFADILKRTLEYNGYSVLQVMNITDVDDKTIRDSKFKYPQMEPLAALKKFTKEYEGYFWEDLKKLNINKPTKITPATKYIREMQKLVHNIYQAGFAYVKDGSVYFDLRKYSAEHHYGELLNIDLTGFKAGARVDADEYEKENIQDFVLWKGEKEGEPSWRFKLAGKNLPGRPGWHIECSAMGETELGCPFDIHIGGVDLKFPHHENEIAQSVVGYDVARPVNYWLHSEHILVDGQKMAKRLNNFYTLQDLEKKGFNSLAYRYLCLSVNYNKKLNFSWQALTGAENSLANLSEIIASYNQPKTGCPEFESDFLKALNDDLNIPKCLSVMWDLIKSGHSNSAKKKTLLKFDEVLGLGLAKIKKEKVVISNTIKKLANERLAARQNKDWKKSDELRKEIEKLGFIIEDSKDGYQIRKK